MNENLKRLAEYLLDVAQRGVPAEVASSECPECGEHVEAYGMNIDEFGHVVDDQGNVVVACEGYYVARAALEGGE